MDKTAVLIRRPTRRSSGDATLWLAHAVIAVFRTLFRIQEFFTSGKKRERLRQFRSTMQTLEHDRDTMLKKIEQTPGRDTAEVLDDFVARHGDPQTRAGWDDTQAELRAIRQESNELQAIVRGAGENKALAAEGVRQYLYVHPNSHSAYSYLGGVLQQTGDLDGSLAAYQQALRLAGDDSIPGASARLQLGSVLQEKGESEAAIAEFRRLIEDSSPETESILCLAYLHLGNALEQNGDIATVRIAWKQAVKWDQTKMVAKQAQGKLKEHP